MNDLSNNIDLKLDLNEIEKGIYHSTYGVFIGFLHNDYIIYKEKSEYIFNSHFKKIRHKNTLLSVEVNSISDDYIILNIIISSENNNSSAKFDIIIKEILERVESNKFSCEKINRELANIVTLKEE